MSTDRRPAVVPPALLRRMVVLLLGVVLVLRALMLPLDLLEHAGQRSGGVSATLLALETSVGVRSVVHPNDVLAVSVSDTSGEPSCHDSHAAAPERSTSADARVCQILCAVACAPLLLPMSLDVAHDAGERRLERAPLLPDGIVLAPEHRPPIA